MLLGQFGLKYNVLTIVVAVFSVLFALATWGVDEIFAKAIGEDFLIG